VHTRKPALARVGWKGEVFMDRRDFERIPVKIDTFFLGGNILSSGTVLNFSDNGMFISLKKPLPFDAMIAIIIHNKIVGTARVKWVNKTDNNYNAGVELLSSFRDYSNTLRECI
jgi:hypothetical protein